VRAYSRQLEEKSRELETATAELRAANEQLQELDRVKDDFMSTVTHELRTPLTSIRSFSEILLDDPEIPVAERKRFLAIVVKETVRLTRLINQMLDMAKIESGNAEWCASELDMHEVIRESVEATSQLFLDRGVDLSVVLCEPAPRIMADRDRMMQVVINLLSNAVKFSPPKQGRVEIRLDAREGFLQVDVKDNGPGISPGDHQAIFEKFRQGSSAVTGRTGGTGLGLSISRRIIEHFGGRLWVESEPNRGSTFSFVLPLRGPLDQGALQSAVASE
jgi:signal transduction histidine kinase